ncbi:MAG: glycosyltransferase [Clostridiales bacterium]|nr:glycosyltransferase [Clostridiales bacterium]
MFNTVELSIIVPVYNTAKYVAECIESIICQIGEHDEVILIDDGSTDESGLICMKYQKKDNRIKLITTVNSGVASARNIGISVAKGEWICFVDADDTLIPGAVAYIKEKLEPGIDVLYFNHHKDREVISFTNKVTDVNADLIIEATLDYFTDLELVYKAMTRHSMIFTACWAKVFKKSIIDSSDLKFNSQLKLSEDTCFCLEYLIYCNVVRICDVDFYRYRKNELSVTSQRTITHISNRNVLLDYIKQINLETPEMKNALYKYIINCIFQLNQQICEIEDKQRMELYKKLIEREDVQRALKNVKGKRLSDGKFQNIYYQVLKILLSLRMTKSAVLLGKLYGKIRK